MAHGHKSGINDLSDLIMFNAKYLSVFQKSVRKALSKSPLLTPVGANEKCGERYCEIHRFRGTLFCETP